MKNRRVPGVAPRAEGGRVGWIRRNRAEAVTLAVLVVLAIGGGGGYLAYREVSTAQIKAAADQYQEDHSYRFQVGDAVKLDSAEDDQGLDPSHGFHAGFDWKGTMVATVVKTAEYPSLAAAGATAGRRLDGHPMDYDDSLDYQGSPVRYVECDLKLENVDAAQEFPEPGLGDKGGYAFNSGVFNLASTDSDDRPFMDGFVWFDGEIPDAPPNDGFCFTLKPGQERTLKMIYAVPKSVPTDHLAMRIGASGDDKYMVALGGQQPQA